MGLPNPAAAYRALALQVRCEAINKVEDPRAVMAASIRRIGAQIGASKGFLGPDTQLVVLPEYFLSGFPMGESLEAWAQRGAVDPDGDEEAAVGALAAAHDVYLSANLYERDPAFPGIYFQASVLWGPDGRVALRYRRLHSLFAPTPHDVWTRYVDTYGLDAVFPVADTPLGRLACIASEEILFPELSRVLALRGAEVFLHSTSEVGSVRTTPKDIARRARSIENLAYVVSANSAGMSGTDIPGASTDGKSQIIDFRGEPLAEAGFGESMTANAELDIAALRRYRARPGMGNLLARNRLDLWAAEYGRLAAVGVGQPGDTHPTERSDLMRTHTDTIARLGAAGVIVAPS